MLGIIWFSISNSGALFIFVYYVCSAHPHRLAGCVRGLIPVLPYPATNLVSSHQRRFRVKVRTFDSTYPIGAGYLIATWRGTRHRCGLLHAFSNRVFDIVSCRSRLT
jgi:hypothetical protein